MSEEVKNRNEINGVEVRIMTRKQMKDLKEAGCDPSFIGDEATNQKLAQISMEMVDWVLENVYDDVNFDEWLNPDCIKLARATYQMSIGDEVEIKNL